MAHIDVIQEKFKKACLVINLFYAYFNFRLYNTAIE